MWMSFRTTLFLYLMEGDRPAEPFIPGSAPSPDTSCPSPPELGGDCSFDGLCGAGVTALEGSANAYDVVSSTAIGSGPTKPPAHKSGLARFVLITSALWRRVDDFMTRVLSRSGLNGG